MEPNVASVSFVNGSNEHNHHISVHVNIAIFRLQLAQLAQLAVWWWAGGTLNSKIICHRSFYTLFYSKFVLETWDWSYFSIRMSAMHKSHMRKRETGHRDRNKKFHSFHHKFNVKTVERDSGNCAKYLLKLYVPYATCNSQHQRT